MDIIPHYSTNYKNHSINLLLDAVYQQNLHYRASELLDLGITDQDDLALAIKRAMAICKAGGIPVRANFMNIYINNNHEIIADWMLSSLARKLVLLNADASNPLVAKIQLKIIENYSL